MHHFYAPLLLFVYVSYFPEELNDLLNQIFNALEEEEGAETDN